MAEIIKNTGLVSGSTEIISGVALAGIGFCGFAKTGIVAGSLAATVQAAIGNVAAGSTFALLQSIGMVGMVGMLGIAQFLPIVGISLMIVSGACYLAYRYFRK